MADQLPIDRVHGCVRLRRIVRYRHANSNSKSDRMKVKLFEKSRMYE